MKQSNFWKCCFNPKVLIGLGIVAAILFIFFRDNINLGSALPFLFILICPLSMLFMMKGMGSMKNKQCDMPQHNHTPADDHKTEKDTTV